MEKLRKYLNLKINGKIKKSFSEDKNQIKLIKKHLFPKRKKILRGMHSFLKKSCFKKI